jgi:hypothetical protein
MTEQPNDGYWYFYLDDKLCRAWPIAISGMEDNPIQDTIEFKWNWDQ